MNTQMIFQEISLKNVAPKKTQNANISDKKAGSSFNDVLKSMPKENTSVEDKKSQKTYSQIIKSTKAAAINFNSSVNETNTSQEVMDDTLKTGDSKKVTDATNSVINGIGALLGIDGNSLKQMITQLDIKPEDLLDASKAEDIINQLSLKLGLSAEQEQVLLSSVQQFAKLAREALDISETQKDSWVVVEGVAIEVTKKEDKPLQSLSHLDEDIKQLANSIKKDNTSLFENVPDKFASMLKDFGIVADKDGKSIREESLDNAGKKVVKSEEKPKIKEVSGSNNSSDKTELLTAKDTDTRSEINFAQNNDQSGSVQKDEFVSKLQSVSSQQRIVRNDLMKQVVDHAKVFIDENRSEMVMHLKPESLGKLTLKLVTENGIVAARFVAENQQVKQILESNMQTLKDSLEKQGMSVQNVSVSVGQEGSQGFGQQEAFERRNHKGSRLTSDELAYVAGIDEDVLTQSNPYEISDNSIDVIA